MESEGFSPWITPKNHTSLLKQAILEAEKGNLAA